MPPTTLPRAWYSAPTPAFLTTSEETILGALSTASARHGLDVTPSQTTAWQTQIALLQRELPGLDGAHSAVFFEFVIPRMGRRIDVVLLLPAAIVVLEFKVGERLFERSAIDPMWDYALDLKNFHAASHAPAIIPVLIATGATNEAAGASATPALQFAADRVCRPLCVAPDALRALLERIQRETTPSRIESPGIVKPDGRALRGDEWSGAPYRPTPTIVEVARALYAQHSVETIARSDAGAANLHVTAQRLETLVDEVPNLMSTYRRWTLSRCW